MSEENAMTVNSISGITCQVADLGRSAEFYETIGFRRGKEEADRVTFYVNWFFLGLLTRSVAEGKLRVPAADGRVPFVSRDDVARCLAALATAPPTARHHEITGPEAIDVARFAAIAEQELRTPVEYVPITPHDYATDLAAAGEDPWWAYAYSSMFASIRELRWGSVSDEVERLTGKPATTVQAVLAWHRSSSPSPDPLS
jgi:NAD(P)H dehydrogenase (quinone)